MKAIVLKTDNTFSIVDANVNLEWLQEQVGGMIEAVFIKNGTMYLNEEGKLKGLPVNVFATELTRKFSKLEDIIVGNVVILGLPDSEGSDTEVSQFYIALFRHFEEMSALLKVK